MKIEFTGDNEKDLEVLQTMKDKRIEEMVNLKKVSFDRSQIRQSLGLKRNLQEIDFHIDRLIQIMKGEK